MSFMPHHRWGAAMNHIEQERFDRLYGEHLQALKLQGKRGKTIDGYARAVRRIAGYLAASLGVV